MEEPILLRQRHVGGILRLLKNFPMTRGFGLRVFEKSYWARDLPSLATIFTDSEDLRPF